VLLRVGLRGGGFRRCSHVCGRCLPRLLNVLGVTPVCRIVWWLTSVSPRASTARRRTRFSVREFSRFL